MVDEDSLAESVGFEPAVALLCLHQIGELKAWWPA
jgi:hypothetical protein